MRVRATCSSGASRVNSSKSSPSSSAQILTLPPTTSRTWPHQNVNLPGQLPCRRHRRHQGQRRTTKGHAPQVLPRVRPVSAPGLTVGADADITCECHRRTGIVYNVTPHAVGVIVYKVVGNRYIEKRVNLRVEHVRHSKCRQEFLDRVKRNHEARAAAKEKGGTYSPMLF